MNNDVSLGILASYKTSINSYDEIFDHNGQVKAHWQKLFDTVEHLGIEKLQEKNEEIVNKLRQNGVTYNIYDGNSEHNRAWKLDPIPFLIHASEWEEIEKGLKQRAKLLDLIVKDIYGPQQLFKDGIIPPELIFDNSGFLRPCIDIKQGLENHLLVCAFDMARGPDGKMWILDNRIQSPSGSGYALENRTILANVFPELNEKIYRKKLSPFFNHLQNTVERLFNSTNESPNVVVLSPGPGNETYFEHVYLASQLGYTLVLGSDLLVRNGYVWLKAIDRLVKVDVIIKRVDDDWSDPLELKETSLLGVPGLLQVMRQGNVAVINPPCTAVCENFGFMAFMHNACRYLLNEPLLMNSVATWWCGQPKELDWVLRNLPKLIIKKTNRKIGFRSIYGRMLNPEQLHELQQMILANPKEYVAQEEVSLSTTPSLINGEIVPRYAAIRAFAVSDGADYQIMQGGLTRSSAIKDKFEISNQMGGFSKDTWIVTDSPVFQEQKRSGSNNLYYETNPITITSRLAENMYWVGRMCERSLDTINFLNIILNRLNENIFSRNKKQPEYLVVLLKTITHLTQTYPGFTDEEDEEVMAEPLIELSRLIKATDLPGSVSYNVKSLIYTVNQISEKWNINTRNIITRLEDSLQVIKEAEATSANQMSLAIEVMYTRLLAFYGSLYENMPRDSAFYLLESGKIIERLLSYISSLRASFSFKNEEEVEAIIMEAVLENHHCLNHFRQIYRSNITLPLVLNMVLLNDTVPNTISYLLDKLAHCLAKLPKTLDTNKLNIAEKNVLKASALIKLIEPENIIKAKKADYRADFDQTLEQVFDHISELNSLLSSMYFNHSLLHHSILDLAENNRIDEV